MRWLALMLLGLLSGCGNDGEDASRELLPLELVVTDYGLYDARVVARTEAGYTPSGHLSQVVASHSRRSRMVPLKAGQTFGFEFVIRDTNAAAADGVARTLTFVIEHPPMTEPNGEVSGGFTHFVTLTPDMLPYAQRFMFTFSEPFELVPGHWLLTIREGAYELARQPFVVGPQQNEGTL